MKSVLISIQPKWCELIASGKKTVEVRKTKPNIAMPFKVYIYCTKNYSLGEFYTSQDDFAPKVQGKVIGEFICDKVVEFENSMYEPGFDETSVLSCVGFEELALYLGEKDFGYGWHISDLVIYDKAKALSEFIRPCDTPFQCDKCKDLVENFGCGRTILRPPQSWCYVESEGDTE